MSEQPVESPTPERQGPEDRVPEDRVGASRRALFAGAGAVGATAVLAACGGDGGGDAGDPGDPGAGRNGDGGPGGGVVATTDQVEVGGGMIIADQGVVVTQPSEGEFKGFSATCTHQGCTVNQVSDGTIRCPCHGSRYSIEDGAVVQAATGLTVETQDPLPAVEIEVSGSEISRV